MHPGDGEPRGAASHAWHAEGVASSALFRRYPELSGRIPWVSLGDFPTPLEPLRLPGFSEGSWVKRDDLSGVRYGGNKVRKLEFVLAAARRAGAERLITVGAMGSHHALATAVYGTALGFRVTLVLFPQPLTEHVRGVLLQDAAFGCELRYAPRMEAIPAALLAARLAHRGERCYTIAAGGSDAFGTLGYVSAALELAEQLDAGAVPRPHALHVATGTMGTAAGLALGFALARLRIRVRAIRITSRLVTNRWALRRLVVRTGAVLRQSGLEPPAVETVLQQVELRHQAIGRGYGYATEDGIRATELFAQAGLTLDPTYTAKAAVDFLDALQAGRDQSLFWHTLSARDPAPVAASLQDLPAPFRRYLSTGRPA